MSKEFIYTFIIPHKNCPNLLKRCVDSIPRFDDIQIIVVDDNSDDDKRPDIKRDGLEVIVLDGDQSKGAGRARNVGLEHAHGRWLLFADADDYYSENLIHLLDRFRDDTSTDIVYLSASKFDENGVFTEINESYLVKEFIQKHPYAEMRLRYDMWTPWSRMVKKDVVDKNHIKFDELPAANDKMFGLLCSKFSKVFEVEEKTIYLYYRPSFNSQTDNKRNCLMFNEVLDLRRRTISIYKEVGYKPIPSLFKIVFFSNYSKSISKRELIVIYRELLNKSKINICTDMYRYFVESFRNKQKLQSRHV